MTEIVLEFHGKNGTPEEFDLVGDLMDHFYSDGWDVQPIGPNEDGNEQVRLVRD